MIRNVFKNLFSTTATRGRLEYLGAMAALIAGTVLLSLLALSATSPFVAYPAFLAAMVLNAGVFFVVAQRVRDIGWNVWVYLGALLVTSALSTYVGASETAAVVAQGGPFAYVYAALLMLLTVVPGKSQPATEAEAVTA